MLQQIQFKNYKAFENGVIEFKPLTILLGANSVGKSSIIQLLLMLAQTANDKGTLSALQVNGSDVSCGSINNLFRLKDTSNPIILDFKLKEDYLKEVVESLFNKVYGTLQVQYLRLSKLGSNEIATLPRGRHLIAHISESKENFVEVCNLLKEEYAQYTNNVDKSSIRSVLSKNNNVFDECLETYTILNTIHSTISSHPGDFFCRITISYNAASKSKTNILYLNDLEVYFFDGPNKKNILCLHIQKPLSQAVLSVSSDIVDISKLNLELSRKKKQIVNNVRSNIFSYFKESLDLDYFLSVSKQSVSLTLDCVIKILSSVIYSIEQDINRDKINYVGPLRAYPQRYYLLDRTRHTTSLDTSNGNEVATIIKNNDALKRMINDWLAHFKIQIDIQTLDDLIHKLKIKYGKLHLDITDVGFGISQVLPVIAQGFFSQNETMTIIEQPEVHLHPKMQADLADLFIDIALPQDKNKERTHQKTLLIETHSEYILRRIRRRIAEGVIKNNDVGIYYIVRSNDNLNTSIIKRIDISKTGAFEWPEEFYGGELYEDTVSFLKHQ